MIKNINSINKIQLSQTQFHKKRKLENRIPSIISSSLFFLIP